VRQLFDEPALGRIYRGFDLTVGGVRASIADVFNDRAVKQTDVLRYEGTRFENPLVRPFMDRTAIQPDFAGLEIVQAVKEREQGGFPAPDGPMMPTFCGISNVTAFSTG
jgi:hypothetical protein